MKGVAFIYLCFRLTNVVAFCPYTGVSFLPSPGKQNIDTILGTTVHQTEGFTPESQRVQFQIEEYLEARQNQRQIEEYLAAREIQKTSKGGNNNVMQQIKDSGIAGIISFGIVQLFFWTLSFPLCVLGFYKVSGHFPDFNNNDDMAKLGAEAFTYVNIARLAAPFRIGASLSLAPWVQQNIIDRFQRK